MATLHGAPPRFEGGLQEVADGVHAWLQPNGTWGETNAALVAGEGASLLVDTLWTPELTRRMLAATASVTAEAPIAWVVNTHADGDHCWGNGVLAGREIVATQEAAEEMRALVPRTLEAFRRLGQAAGLASRVPLPYPGRASARAVGAYFTGMLRPFDFSEVRPTYPTQTFSGSLSLDVGGRAVELIEVGPAHTEGDLVVWLPDARTVIAADIVFNGVTAVMWAGPAERWIAALDRIAQLEPRVVVPGHGPVSATEDVRVLRDYWAFVDVAASEHFAAGRPAGEAARAILRTPEYAAAPWAGWDNPERTLINVETVYRRARLEAGAPSPLKRVAMFAEAARLAAELRAGRGP